MEFERKKPEEIGKISLERNVRTWKIYNMPVELINQYISYAKLYFNNEVWRVLEKGMKLIKEEETEWKVQVEKRLRALEEEVFGKKEGWKGIHTFGGGTADE